MSTRKLILTALLCGLAILIAGMIFLLRTQRQQGPAPAVPASRAGLVIPAPSWTRP